MTLSPHGMVRPLKMFSCSLISPTLPVPASPTPYSQERPFCTLAPGQASDSSYQRGGGGHAPLSVSLIMHEAT